MSRAKLSFVDSTCASSDEFLAIMALRFGASCASDLTSVATVVPVTCGPWREEIAVELLGLLTSTQLDGIDSAICATLQRALLDSRAAGPMLSKISSALGIGYASNLDTLFTFR